MCSVKPKHRVFQSVYFIFCYIFSVILALHSAGAYEYDGELVFAQILHRHGDRTPLAPYETDPWKDLKYWPTEWGQLTNTGKNQMYELGIWIRKRYDHFLPREYSLDDIYVMSSDVDRALMSGECCLASLYKPVGADIWRSDMKWQPVPIHSIPQQYDNTIQQTASCPNYDKLLEAHMNSAAMKKIQTRYAYLYSYLTKHTGQNISTVAGVTLINNTLYIESLNNKRLPAWTVPVYPGADMEYISHLWYLLPTITRPMTRLKAGPLLKEILDRFAQKANKTLTPDRKMWVYSAHDTTMVALLNALKVYQNQPLNYASTLILELRIDCKNRPLVSMTLKDGPKKEPIIFPDCGLQCPLKRLYKLYKDVIPENWKLECGFAC